MELALQAACEAAARGEVPVGAVVTGPSGEVLAIAGNRTEADHDATAHAEILALREAARRAGSPRLPECDLWVTLEPCPMCATAAALFRVRRVVFGAYDPKGGGIEHGPRIYATTRNLHRPEVVGGMLETRAKALLQDFFLSKRPSSGMNDAEK
jgi:tRNA(Arg) A34 adenosine deaminase TadA